MITHREIPEGKVVTWDTIDEFADYGVPEVSKRTDSGWLGGMSGMEAIRTARTGHLPSVEASERYLAEFENMEFTTRKHEIIADVAGGAVNVGAYLSGSPMAMRRRKAVVSPAAPLTIFCDVGSSAVINAEKLKKRGAVVVALARMLSATRPVTLYGVDGASSSSISSYLGNKPRRSAFGMVRMPLDDLSRAAFVMAHPAAQRGIMYGNLDHMMGSEYGGWAFGNIDTYRKNALRIFAGVLGVPESECLYIPAIFMSEDRQEPTVWLREMLAKYGVASGEQE